MRKLISSQSLFRSLVETKQHQMTKFRSLLSQWHEIFNPRKNNGNTIEKVNTSFLMEHASSLRNLITQLRKRIDSFISSDGIKYKSQELNIDQISILIWYKMMNKLDRDDLLSLLGKYNRGNEQMLQVVSNQKSIISFHANLMNGKKNPQNTTSDMNVLKNKASKILTRAKLLENEIIKYYQENIQLKMKYKPIMDPPKVKDPEEIIRINDEIDNDLNRLMRDHRINLSRVKRDNDAVLNEIRILEAKIDSLDQRIDLMTKYEKNSLSNPNFNDTNSTTSIKESLSAGDVGITDSPIVSPPLNYNDEEIKPHRNFRPPLIPAYKSIPLKVKEPQSLTNLPSIQQSPRQYQKPVVACSFLDRHKDNKDKYPEASEGLVSEITEMIQKFQEILKRSRYGTSVDV